MLGGAVLELGLPHTLASSFTLPAPSAGGPALPCLARALRQLRRPWQLSGSGRQVLKLLLQLSQVDSCSSSARGCSSAAWPAGWLS